MPIKIGASNVKDIYVGSGASYRYIKWEITANKQATSGYTVTQMSEFEICDTNGTKMSRPSGTSITGNVVGPSGETVDKIIDGSVYTKYCPNGNLPIIITIDLKTAVDFSTYCKYKWYTANDSQERDPVTWTLSLSNDGSNWKEVSTVTNATITSSRRTLAGTWDISLSGNVSAVYVGTTKVRPTGYRSSWDITTAVQDQSRQPQSISSNRNITVSSDGYHILLVNENQPVYEYTLSTPRDLTSTITIKTKSFTSLGSAGYCSAVVYSEDGNYLYVHFGEQYPQSCVIAQYQLSTPFDITTAGNAIASKMITGGYDIGGFRFYDNGTKIIGDLRDNANIFTGQLGTAWDITTLSNLVKQGNKGYCQGFTISSDGKNCYMTDEYHSNMTQLTTTTPYDFTTSTSKTRARPGTYTFGIDVTADGKYLFVARKNGYIYRYSFTELS